MHYLVELSHDDLTAIFNDFLKNKNLVQINEISIYDFDCKLLRDGVLNQVDKCPRCTWNPVK